MIQKQLLVPDRVRRPPREGWSWIDRRFLKQHASRLSHEAILLYFFLAAVSDQNGLSFYSDTSTAMRLRMGEQAVVRARDELVAEDLVAHQEPLTQVLSLPERGRTSRGGLASLGEIFQALGQPNHEVRGHRRSPQRIGNARPRPPRPTPSLESPPNNLQPPRKAARLSGTHWLCSTGSCASSQRYHTPKNHSCMLAERTQFIRLCGMTHVRTSPYYPQSNGKKERWFGTLKRECIRPNTPLSLEEARRLVARFVEHYNTVRLHSAIGYVTPADKLLGLEPVIHAERDRKLEEAHTRRQQMRQALRGLDGQSAPTGPAR